MIAEIDTPTPVPMPTPVPTPARPVLPRQRLIGFLWRLGWLLYGSLEEALSYTDPPELEIAVRAYQGFHGLDVDGWAGPETERSLETPRFCGHPDVMPVQLELNRWPDPHIAWWIDPATLAGLPIDAATVAAAFQWAWAQWAAVCGIQPRQAQSAGEAQVVVQFGTIDGPSNVLAWSELANNQQTRKSQRFDRQEAWVNSATPPSRAIDLGRVACHEIGHVLGLPHIASGNLLQPTYDVRIRVPQAGDIAEVVARYGPPVAAPAPAPAPAPTPSPSPEPPIVPPAGDWAITLSGKGEITGAVIPGFRVTRIG